MSTIRSLTEVRNKECTDCELCKTAEYICLTGYGKVPAKIMLIGEAPGERQDDSGVPFVGRSGKLLTTILGECGITREETYITNVVHCRPPENRKPTLEEIRACRKYLLKEIKLINPLTIITLGDTAIKGLFNTNLISISSSRGKVLEFEEDFIKCKVISTYHPAYALRKPEAAKWIYADIRNGLANIRNKSTGEKLNYQVITQKNANAVFKELTATNEVVVDVETNSLDMFDPKGELLMVGFCNQEGKAWVYFNTTPGMLEFTQKVLDNVDLIIGHNIKFDLKWLLTRGITYKKAIWDTMVALHLLDENYPEKGLKYLARTELGTFGQTLIELEQVIKKHWLDKTEPTKEEWTTYNGGDVDATFRLYKKYLDGLKQEGLEVLMAQEMKVLKVLTYMEMSGFYIDKKAFNDLKKKYEKLIQEAESQVKANFGDVNLRSTPQLRKVLYEKRNLPVLVTTQGGSPSCNEAALQALLGTRLKKEDKEAVEVLLRFRNVEKLYSVYIKGMVENGLIKSDSRIHCNYKIAGTVTGRLSCSDPNLQNIPREGDIKLMFASRFPGGSIIQGDYSQAELRLLAHHAKSTSLIKAFESGRDIHTEVATKVFRKPYDQITEQERKYTKQVNFGIVYLISPMGMAGKIGVSEGRARKLIDDWFKEFPEVKTWINRMKLLVVSQGYTQNIFGRKRRFFSVNPDSSEGRESQRQGVNSPIQGGAGDLTKWSMMKVYHRLKKEGFKTIVIGNVHDAIMLDSPKEEVKEAARILKEIGENPPMKLLVPLQVDLKVGPSWGQLEKMEKEK